ncbi:hypothetical protein PHYBLDRAFT_175516 [Phycomyces blakesleeanus NRRL 1555(-)]|uniref:Uncharacterized protein n=1 Tax=Phycomyces blakesleeanus (strain ATCC 8743b / DSM 1359 / FGSC 10004 / NBRC 33097 / NRRL 1555) TaxID=763407 RepID=A0A162TDB3_PHYB8|nr:hypothetical protein PHYBLDRAFT_175516 [Phycomyces blakesleeanus NRRL 1555(-)]OAD66223.1 hypothetical protein PHYBLDRAFT_175516 [Phycomyces blakesleeanus NRRL 1555(-)]|eukprot:XP_018284263.1 hypothetical protein PHYBLDRAFT_175516 [Phycomyces blakesleeanus NRRL 1555(-)]
MQHDGSSTIDDSELISDSDYAMNAIEINKTISYKFGCSFEDSESEAHVYDSSRISSNTFRKAELMSIHLSQLMLQYRISRAAYRDTVQFVNTIIQDHDEIMLELGAKISHGKTINALLKSKSSVKGHEYDVCLSGCQLYGINDNQESCVDCGEPRYKTDPEQSETPSASMKLMSASDMFSQMLADPATRELLHYRANRKSVAGQLTNVFDSNSYKQLVQQDLFSNPNDIAIELYTNGFVNQKKGKSLYTIVHAVVFNLDPSISEIKDLEVYGLVIKSNGVEVCRAKIHLLLASSDIPAVADMVHIGSHASLFGCQICETKGKSPDNRRYGMYFEDSSAPLQPLEDFKTGNPIIARGIGKHMYNLITVSLTKETKIFYTRPDDTLFTTEYPFFIPRTRLVTIGNCITSSFDNIFSKIDGTRAVDWLDFLLYIVPTLVVPFLPNRAVKTVVLSLVKGCALALQWTLTSELLDKMDVNRHFKHWHHYLSQQVQNKTISRSAFRPVQHYLVHIPFIVNQLDLLRCYSTQSMERVIGVFSKLIKSKCKDGHNASFLVERFTLHNYVNTAISIQNEIDLIQPKPYGRESYMDLPNDPSGAQLWEPFHQFAQLNDDLIEGVSSPRVKDILTRYYQQTSGLMISDIGDSTIVVASRLWMNLTLYSSCINNCNIIVYNWLVGAVVFFFQHEDSLGSLSFFAFVEVMKEYDVAAHDSSVPIVKQRLLRNLN